MRLMLLTFFAVTILCQTAHAQFPNMMPPPGPVIVTTGDGTMADQRITTATYPDGRKTVLKYGKTDTLPLVTQANGFTENINGGSESWASKSREDTVGFEIWYETRYEKRNLSTRGFDGFPLDSLHFKCDISNTYVITEGVSATPNQPAVDPDIIHNLVNHKHDYERTRNNQGMQTSSKGSFLTFYSGTGTNNNREQRQTGIEFELAWDWLQGQAMYQLWKADATRYWINAGNLQGGYGPSHLGGTSWDEQYNYFWALSCDESPQSQQVVSTGVFPFSL